MTIAVAMAVTQPAQAGAALDGSPKVSFFATGRPGFLSIEGKSRSMALADDGTELVFTVPVASLDTGIALRDEHMRDTYVEVSKFPDLVLSVPRAGITWPSDGRANGTVTAAFTAHGVTRDVPVEYRIDKTKAGWSVKASFPFDVADHGIAIPEYLGVTILPDMRAEVVVGLVDGP